MKENFHSCHISYFHISTLQTLLAPSVSLKHTVWLKPIKPLFSAISLNLLFCSVFFLFLTFPSWDCSVRGSIGVPTSRVSTPLLLTVYSDMSNDSISSDLIAVRSLYTEVRGWQHLESHLAAVSPNRGGKLINHTCFWKTTRTPNTKRSPSLFSQRLIRWGL